MVKTILDTLSKKNLQDLDENWIWWSSEAWKSEMCKPEHQEKMVVLSIVDEQSILERTADQELGFDHFEIMS